MITRTPPKIKSQTHISYPPGLSPHERIKARELMLKIQDEKEELVKKQMEEYRSKLGQTNPKEFLQTTTPIRSRPKLRGKGKSKLENKIILDSSNILPSKKMTDYSFDDLINDLKKEDAFKNKTTEYIKRVFSEAA